MVRMNSQRRRFCQATGGLILAGAIVPSVSGCGSGASTGSPTSVYAGLVSDLAVDGILMVPAADQNINVCRDSGGFYALDGNCTHAHCVLLFMDASNPNGFACPCHASTFDYNGENPTGPAAQTGPLPHYKVTISGNDIYVDYGIMVDPSVRVTM